MNTNPIYCAIDTSSIDDALKLVKETAPYIGGVKLGLEFFTSCGIEGVETIAKSEIPLFLDLKLYDIPNTVKKSLKNISYPGGWGVPVQRFDVLPRARAKRPK